MAEYAIAQASGVDTALRWRWILGGLFPDSAADGWQVRSGLLYANAGNVALSSGMSVTVTGFRAFIQGTAGANQQGYFCILDSTKTLTFDDGGASARTDIIVARVYDNTYDASGFTKFAVEIVKGTPGGGTPATPASAIKLAEKVISAGMSAGTGGLGTAPVDKRPPALVTRGGMIPVVDATDRATLSPYKGMTIYRIDTKTVQLYTGSGADAGWDTIAYAPRPAVFEYAASGSPQTVPNNTATLIDLTTTDFVLGTIFDDTGGDRIVVVNPGVYRVTGIISWAGVGGGSAGYRQTDLLINNVVRFTTRVNAVSGTGGTYGVTASGLVKLAAGDAITMKASHTQGASLATAPAAPGYVSLSAELVSS